MTTAKITMPPKNNKNNNIVKQDSKDSIIDSKRNSKGCNHLANISNQILESKIDSLDSKGVHKWRSPLTFPNQINVNKNRIFTTFNKSLESKDSQKILESSEDFRDSTKSKQDSIIVLDSTFLKSIQNISQAPSVLYSEIAMLGRSNVGKSTLINLLLNNKNLAKSSSTPGKTRLINFFLSSWKKHNTRYDLRFIDFPGFGYAKVSKMQKSEWDRNLSEFLAYRDSIKLFIHIVDSRHTNLAIDNEIDIFLKRILRPDSSILEVFTKCDKLSKNDFYKLRGQNKICISHNDKQSVESLRNVILNKLYEV